MRGLLSLMLAIPLAVGCGDGGDNKPDDDAESTEDGWGDDGSDGDWDGTSGDGASDGGGSNDDGGSTDGGTDDGSADDGGSGATCEDDLSVTGQFTLGDSVIAIDEVQGDGLNLTLIHKIDVDTEEAGCVEFGTLDISQGGLGCTVNVDVVRSEDGTFSLGALSFVADSYCPDFLDDAEGNYTLATHDSTSVSGLPNQVEMTTGTEDEVCIEALDLQIETAGSMRFESDGTAHAFGLILVFEGDIWTIGSTDADCDVVTGGDDGGDGDADLDGGPADGDDPADDPDADADDGPSTDMDGDGFTSFVDCDDGDPTSFPGAEEIAYDGIDQDCSGADLDDVDRDGHVGAAGGTDCDDADPTSFPGAEEIPYDGIDQDCDGADLCDLDGDGFDWVGVGGEDCADGDPSVHPGYDGWATFETSAGSWDWNCDGAEETESVGFGSCSGTGFCSLDSVGWADVSPACGDSGLWVNDCEGLTCDESGEARVQRCR